ncbi:uncharacterized protein LOC135197958 [Macrobrachium nipponense]|uniref:uncharacterized protein LOC135197958 n=1 Tax=Macrobrachium nipponense TaxID=159736 RepID=UPI0030C7A2B8
MEIQVALADFSEEILLDHIRYQCEATGIIYDSHDAGPYSSDDDALRDSSSYDAAEASDGPDKASAERGRETPTSVKARARSIDSGVCIVDQRKETSNAAGAAGGSHKFDHHDRESSLRRALPDPPDGEPGSSFNAGAAASASDSDGQAASASLDAPCSSLILPFKKGDIFAVLLEDSDTWWGVMALRTTAVGYVPRNFLKFVEVRHLWLTSQGEKSSREVHMKALSDLQTATSRLPHPEVVYGAMIPEPDYSDDESEIKSTNMVARNNKVNSTNSDKEQQKPPPQTNSNGRLDEKGLIMPKKLINPCLESSEKKNLHRELMFNQKMGVNVLNQKTELQKAMERHNDKKILKEQEKEKKSQLTPFQKALDERAQRIEQMEKSESKEAEKVPSSEFEKIHAKVRAKMEVQ